MNQKVQMENPKDEVEKKLQLVVESITSENIVDTMKIALIKTGKPSDKWTLRNRILAAFQGTLDARGFNQWNEVERRVNKGSHAIHILGPIQKSIPKVNRTTGLVEKDENGKDVYIKITVGFKMIPVFRIEDTNGKSVEYQPTKLPELVQVARKFGIKVRYDDTSIEGAYGYFNRHTNEIVLGTEEVGVFFHELAHVAHVRTLGLKKFKEMKIDEIETVAQLSSCVLASIFGYEMKDCLGHTQSYIKMFQKDKSLAQVARIVSKVYTQVQNVVELILYENQGVQDDSL